MGVGRANTHSTTQKHMHTQRTCTNACERACVHAAKAQLRIAEQDSADHLHHDALLIRDQTHAMRKCVHMAPCIHDARAHTQVRTHAHARTSARRVLRTRRDRHHKTSPGRSDHLHHDALLVSDQSVELRGHRPEPVQQPAAAGFPADRRAQQRRLRALCGRRGEAVLGRQGVAKGRQEGRGIRGGDRGTNALLCPGEAAHRGPRPSPPAPARRGAPPWTGAGRAARAPPLCGAQGGMYISTMLHGLGISKAG